MKKLKYTKPEIVTVTFRVETVMDSLAFGRNNSSLYHDYERYKYDNDFGTGETYGAYTDAGGEYSTGSW